MSSIRDRAIAVLRTNDRGAHTIPSSRLYPHRWAWDSAFAAIGWSTVDVDRALTEVEAIMSSQWPDGRVPHIAFDVAQKDYFPGPEFWRAGSTSSISNPPVWATALRVVFERGADRSRVAALLDGMESSLSFIGSARDPLGWGGFAVAHPWESGRDNCPAWDEPLAAIDPNDAPAFERVDVAKVADPGQRPSEEQYRRFAALVHAIANDGHGPGPFAVYDPFMTAITAAAARDLAVVSTALGRDASACNRIADRAIECLERLWSPEHDRFAFVDARASRRYCPDVAAAYLPGVVLADPAIRARVERALDERYATERRLATVAPGAPDFDPRCYWRGPVWVNINWLFVHFSNNGWGDALAQETLALLRESGFWEYFHPQTGAGLGTDCFTWSAALALDLLDRSSSPE